MTASDININSHQEGFEGKLSTDEVAPDATAEAADSDELSEEELSDDEGLSDEEAKAQALADKEAAADAAADAAFAASPRAADELAVLNARDETVAQAAADKARADVMTGLKPDALAISNSTGAAKMALDEEADAGTEEEEAKFVEAEDPDEA